jgi:hypothetical protein
MYEGTRCCEAISGRRATLFYLLVILKVFLQSLYQGSPTSKSRAQ